MREIRPSGSKGGGAKINRFFLPLSFAEATPKQFHAHWTGPRGSAFERRRRHATLFRETDKLWNAGIHSAFLCFGGESWLTFFG